MRHRAERVVCFAVTLALCAGVIGGGVSLASAQPGVARAHLYRSEVALYAQEHEIPLEVAV